MLCCCCLSTLLLDMPLEGLVLVVLHDKILLDEDMHIIKGNKEASSTYSMERWAKNKHREI
jgi:hypothetical protein